MNVRNRLSRFVGLSWRVSSRRTRSVVPTADLDELVQIQSAFQQFNRGRNAPVFLLPYLLDISDLLRHFGGGSM